MSNEAPRRALSFDAMAPLSLPLRYLLTAPLFAALAAALLLWRGEAALLTRWSPFTLALTHLLVLGCLSMTMIGALLQILPVVAGIALPRANAVAPAVHAGLCVGTVLLAAAFWRESPVLFQLAPPLLALSLLAFVGACTVDMWQQHAPGSGAVVAGIRLALAALVVTVALGAMLAAAWALPGLAAAGMLPSPTPRLTDIHALWGLLGWVGMLVTAVAFQVVPMFMGTRPYPAFLTGGYTAAMFVLLAAASVSNGLQGPGRLFHLACLVLLAAGQALFAVVTLALLARRARGQRNPTTLYWQTAMACLLAALAFGLWSAVSSDLWPERAPSNAGPLALGVMLIAGFALCAVNGMLYKIVPFLTWYHLQAAGARPPGINKIIGARGAYLQYGLHLAALALLLGACHQPMLLRPGAALLCLACLGLWLNLCTALRLYRRLAGAPRKPAAAAAVRP